MKKLRILVADDHDVVREGIRTLLQTRPDWEICDEAANGREAVEKAKQSKPNVVVLDFSMPELNGVDVTRLVRKALPDTEVLIFTMHNSEQLAREVLAVGARGFILKTEAKRCLIPAVEALADHKPYFAASVSAILLDSFLHPDKDARGAHGDRLTAREREIIQLVAEGLTSKEIAAKLGLSSKTIDAHRANLMNKLDVHSVSELVRYAVRNQMVQA